MSGWEWFFAVVFGAAIIAKAFFVWKMWDAWIELKVLEEERRVRGGC